MITKNKEPLKHFSLFGYLDLVFNHLRPPFNK